MSAAKHDAALVKSVKEEPCAKPAKAPHDAEDDTRLLLPQFRRSSSKKSALRDDEKESCPKERKPESADTPPQVRFTAGEDVEEGLSLQTGSRPC